MEPERESRSDKQKEQPSQQKALQGAGWESERSHQECPKDWQTAVPCQNEPIQSSQSGCKNGGGPRLP